MADDAVAGAHVDAVVDGAAAGHVGGVGREEVEDGDDAGEGKAGRCNSEAAADRRWRAPGGFPNVFHEFIIPYLGGYCKREGIF